MLSVQKVLLLLGFLLRTILASSSNNVENCNALSLELEEEDCLDDIMHPVFNHHHSMEERSLLLGEDSNSYWLQKSKEELRKRQKSATNMKIAKNIIFFLGEGMGLTTIAAARNFLGGEEQKFSFETFPTVGLSKTYSVDKIVPDAACTATAYLCGVKGNLGTIGLNGEVKKYNCDNEEQSDHHVDSIAKWALDAGKAAGFVTTSRVTHASTAALYAHSANHNWESDATLKRDCGEQAADLQDIAQQLIESEVGKKLKVILGGGRTKLIERLDKRNLIKEFIEQSSKNVYVETAKQLRQANPLKSERLLGLFNNNDLEFHLSAKNSDDEPTLEAMTEKALEFMAKAEHGYFLFIAAAGIGLGHDENKPRLALGETLEFSKAIALARNRTNENETLIVVTADHSNTFNLAGYQKRGSDIFDIADNYGKDRNPYLALSYANGPSFEKYFDTKTNSRRNPKDVLNKTANDMFPSTVPLSQETNGAEDVPVFALGPWAHLFSGVYEQNLIPHLLAYAACLGDGLKACI